MGKSKASAEVFYKTEVRPEFEVPRLHNNLKALNGAKGNCEHGLKSESGEALRERIRYVYHLLQTFRPSKTDSEENEAVVRCISYLRAAWYGCWSGEDYTVLRACLVELYPALSTLRQRLKLWESIETHGEVCKAARDAAAYRLPRMGGEDFATTVKKGATMPDELREAIRERVAIQGGAKRRKRGQEDESAKAESQ